MHLGGLALEGARRNDSENETAMGEALFVLYYMTFQLIRKTEWEAKWQKDKYTNLHCKKTAE